MKLRLKIDIMRTEIIEQLVKEYKEDPNCYPELWVRGEGLSYEEEKEFINLCLQ